MTSKIEKLYDKYFQKSRSFLLPILGYKKSSQFKPIQSYLAWDNVFSIEDRKLIVVYKNYKTKEWNKFLLELMNNQMFNDYHETEDENVVVLSFDLNCISQDYQYVLEGKYSKLSKLLKKSIRDFYTYSSPEWAYMEAFLFPERHVETYSKLLDVKEEHIKFSGELCNLPDLEKETLKLKPNGTNNDVDKLNMEHRKDFQTDIN